MRVLAPRRSSGLKLSRESRKAGLKPFSKSKPPLRPPALNSSACLTRILGFGSDHADPSRPVRLDVRLVIDYDHRSGISVGLLRKRNQRADFSLRHRARRAVAGRTVSPSYTTRRSSGAMEEAVGVLCRFKGLLDVPLADRRSAGLGARGRVLVWRPLAANVSLNRDRSDPHPDHRWDDATRADGRSALGEPLSATVNGAAIFLKSGAAKFPSLAGLAISRRCDRRLRSLAGGRDVSGLAEWD